MITWPGPSVGLLQVTLTLPASFSATTDTLPSVGGDTSIGEHSEHNYKDMSLHEFVTLVPNIMLYIQMYENVVDTDRKGLSELRQTDNDWDF